LEVRSLRLGSLSLRFEVEVGKFEVEVGKLEVGKCGDGWRLLEGFYFFDCDNEHGDQFITFFEVVRE